jgi:hypothetical protein
MSRLPASKHQPRGVHEDAKYSIPDRHCDTDGPGTTKEGQVLTNQVYRQPWKDHDGVADPNGDSHEG